MFDVTDTQSQAETKIKKLGKKGRKWYKFQKKPHRNGLARVKGTRVKEEHQVDQHIHQCVYTITYIQYINCLGNWCKTCVFFCVIEKKTFVD